MKTVTLTKVERDEIKVLQQFCMLYVNRIEKQLNPQMTVTFYQLVMEADILRRLVVLFRSRLESDSVKYILKFKASEAAVLFFACQEWFKLGDTAEETYPYKNHVAIKFTNGIDAQLKSILIRLKDPEPEALYLK